MFDLCALWRLDFRRMSIRRKIRISCLRDSSIYSLSLLLSFSELLAPQTEIRRANFATETHLGSAPSPAADSYPGFRHRSSPWRCSRAGKWSSPTGPSSARSSSRSVGPRAKRSYSRRIDCYLQIDTNVRWSDKISSLGSIRFVTVAPYRFSRTQNPFLGRWYISFFVVN